MRATILINGPINVGKSTVGALVAELLPCAIFIDGDDHDAPDDAPLAAHIEAAWRRIEARVASETADSLIVAYPIDDAQHARLCAACAKRGARLFVVTLAPPIGIALSDRGDRKLAADEKERIVEMYAEGYASREFSSLVIDNGAIAPNATAKAVVAHLTEALAKGTAAGRR